MIVCLLGLLVLPPHAWWRAKRTGYFVTNQRAFLVLAIGSGEVFSYDPEALNKVIIHEMATGSGEILLEYHLDFLDSWNTDAEGHSTHHTRRVEKAVGFLELQQVAPPQRALEMLLGRELVAERVTTISLNYEHPL